MKKRSFILGILCAFAVLVNGQFEKAMGKNIPAVFTSSNAEELQRVINQLERIGGAEQDRWEPYYYVAYGYIKMSGWYETIEEKDKYLNMAIQAIEKGEAIKPHNSELETLKGYAIMMQLAADPASRGMTHSGQAMASFQKAIQLNPENPRAYFLLGQMQYGTAQFMGSGHEGACESLNSATILFEREDSSSNPIAPAWGKEANQQAINKMCGEG